VLSAVKAVNQSTFLLLGIGVEFMSDTYTRSGATFSKLPKF